MGTSSSLLLCSFEISPRCFEQFIYFVIRNIRISSCILPVLALESPTFPKTLISINWRRHFFGSIEMLSPQEGYLSLNFQRYRAIICIHCISDNCYNNTFIFQCER